MEEDPKGCLSWILRKDLIMIKLLTFDYLFLSLRHSLKPVGVELQLKMFKAKNDQSKVDYCKADNNVYFKLLGVIVEKHNVFL